MNIVVICLISYILTDLNCILSTETDSRTCKTSKRALYKKNEHSMLQSIQRIKNISKHYLINYMHTHKSNLTYSDKLLTISVKVMI